MPPPTISASNGSSSSSNRLLSRSFMAEALTRLTQGAELYSRNACYSARPARAMPSSCRDASSPRLERGALGCACALPCFVAAVTPAQHAGEQAQHQHAADRNHERYGSTDETQRLGFGFENFEREQRGVEATVQHHGKAKA